MTEDLYAPLIERDLEAIPAAVRAFRASRSSEELWVSIARFAVLAYAPAQHGKHAFLACLAAHDVREEMGERWDELLIECARYAAQARQPWSEPPILDPPDPLPRADVDALRECVRDGDRIRGERWLSARLADEHLARDLYLVATDDFEDLGHKLIVTNAAFRLAPLLGEKGRYALLRVAIVEMTSYRGEEPAQRGAPELSALLRAAVDAKGALEPVHRVFLYAAARDAGVLERLPVDGTHGTDGTNGMNGAVVPPLMPYRLARDYAQTVKAHSLRLEHPLEDAFVAAVHRNLAEGESFDEWQ